MPFTLQVEFTGLCLYLEHADRKQVGILMPDCRKVLGNDLQHEDGTPGVPHVGYLRFNLANLVDASATATGSECEVVYRFSRQHLDFNLAPTGNVIEGETELPRFEEIANEKSAVAGGPPVPLLEPRPGLFSTDPGEAPLLMRTVIEGGNLTAEGKEFWTFPQVLRRGTSVVYKDDFRSVATWTRPVEESDVLTITLTDFDGKNPVEIRLRPITAGGVIPLKVANLCAENPLEWDEFEPRLVTGNDVDFKWLFRLLRATNERTYPQLLKNTDGKLREFPIPMRARGGGLGRQDCFGGALKVDAFT